MRVRASIASSIVHSVDDEDDAFLVRLLVVVAFRGGFIRNVATTKINANGSSVIILRAVVVLLESHHSIDRLTRECVSD